MKRLESTNGTKRILLVDDNKTGTPARRSALEEQGYAVGTAMSGPEALESFQQVHYDLVVTDYKMPKMNGAELIAALRASHPDLPAILLSGFAEAGGLSESNTGANIVLQKGANECAHLVRAVTKLLNPRSARKPLGVAMKKTLVKRRIH